MVRRQLLGKMSALAGAAVAFFAGADAQTAAPVKRKLNILMRSSWGSDDPTRASFPFIHAVVLANAGHEVRIFLTGEATGVLRKATANAVVPVGWPPLVETLQKIKAGRIAVFA